MQEIVIKILNETYQNIVENGFIYDEDGEEISHAIINGTVLPKGHGRLVDADEIDNNIYDLTRSMDLNYGQISEVVDTAPTIIEADKENAE